MDRGVWTAKTVKQPRQQPAHPQYANYWAPLTRKRHTPHIQHSPGTPTTGLRERGNNTSGSTGRSGRQNAATQRNMRRGERVTVQGPVKKQQCDGMSHGGGAKPLPRWGAERGFRLRWSLSGHCATCCSGGGCTAPPGRQLMLHRRRLVGDGGRPTVVEGNDRAPQFSFRSFCVADRPTPPPAPHPRPPHATPRLQSPGNARSASGAPGAPAGRRAAAAGPRPGPDPCPTRRAVPCARTPRRRRHAPLPPARTTRQVRYKGPWGPSRVLSPALWCELGCAKRGGGSDPRPPAPHPPPPSSRTRRSAMSGFVTEPGWQRRRSRHATSLRQRGLSSVRKQRCPMCHSVVSAAVAPTTQ